MLLAQRTVWTRKERVWHALFASRADKAVRMPRRLQRIDHLTFDRLLAAGANRAERSRKAVGAVGEIVFAFLDFAAVGEVFATRVATQMISVPSHTKRLQHNIMNLLTATTTSCHFLFCFGAKTIEHKMIRGCLLSFQRK